MKKLLNEDKNLTSLIIPRTILLMKILKTYEKKIDFDEPALLLLIQKQKVIIGQKMNLIYKIKLGSKWKIMILFYILCKNKNFP